jgi:hypothetical protein
MEITINIDFDGTCVTHDYPKVGHDIGAVKVLKKLTDNGHKLILFTMRSDAPFPEVDGKITTSGLGDAINWFLDNDIPLYGVQKNPTQHGWTSSPKSYAKLMIDDSALGCPLKVDPKVSTRPFVDWLSVEKMLIQMQLIK